MAQTYTPMPGFQSTVSRGSSGADTAQVQTWLNRVGQTSPNIERLAVDGNYGPATERAVRAFQTTAALPADGIVGQRTWNALYDRHAMLAGPGHVYPGVAVKEGDRGAVVKAIQQQLKTTVPSLVDDGIFGRRTRGAVSAWQTLNGLTADGIVGPETFEKLF